MNRTLLQAKLHRAKVTGAVLDYEGSCAIDEALLDAAGLVANQYIEIYNVSNGERFATYVLKARRDSGEICLNGASARKVAIGDLVIICAYSYYTEAEVEQHTPIVVLVDEANRVREVIRRPTMDAPVYEPVPLTVGAVAGAGA